DYHDPGSPIAVALEAFSPFIPLNTDDSSLPATLLTYRVLNVSSHPIEVELVGWLENAVCLDTGRLADGERVNRIVREPDALRLDCLAEPAPEPPARRPRPTIVLADFDGDSYTPWKAEGAAFGTRPSLGATGPEQHLSGFVGKGLVNTWS